MTAAAGPAHRPARVIGLAVIAPTDLLNAMDLTVLFLAVPAITRDLHPSSGELLWITDIHGLLVAGHGRAISIRVRTSMTRSRPRRTRFTRES